MSVARIFSLVVLAASTLAIHAQGSQLKFNVNGVSKDTVYLANYYGNRLYYADTAIADAKGNIVFKRSKPYEPGVYALVVPGPKYFELVVNEPVIEMSSDTSDINGQVKVVRSEENRIFYEYIRFLADLRRNANEINAQLQIEHDPIRKASLQGRLNDADQQVLDYQKDMIRNNPEKFVAAVVRMSMNPEYDQPLKEDGSLDSLAAYFVFRDHYWDHFDLKDDRIVRTPVFHNKLEEFFKGVVPQVPDTINKLADDLIARTKGSGDVFKYIVHHITYRYETSDIMGMDAVFAHMGQTYYCPRVDGKSRATWMSEEKLDQMCERVEKLSPLLIGKLAPYLKLPDSTEHEWISFYDLPQDYVVLVFWDPHCGHCKKELPILKAAYDSVLKDMNVEVYAVAKAVEDKTFADWKKLIREFGLDWINVGLTVNVYKDAKSNPMKYIPKYTTLGSLNYGETYDVYSTPKIFIVDKEHKIVAKQLAADQIVDLIKRLKGDS